MAIDLAKAQACEKALREAGCYPGPQVFNFLAKKGFTSRDFMSHGGWMPVLIDMVPDEYQTYNELAQTIKATR